MQLGIHYYSFAKPGPVELIAPTLAASAKAAEAGGVTTFTLMDHWFQMEDAAPATDPMMEGYTSLGYLAGLTSSMTLGLLVTGVTYRQPGLLAKTVATLDVLSGGRAMLGIGAAWYEREHLGLGVPFPGVSERFERLEETLQICRQMWGEDDGPYAGKHYQLAETLCRPAPMQRPYPRVLIGGMGEKKTLKLVAQYADACNLFAFDPAVIKHKIEVLHRHCEDAGRDPKSVDITIMGGPDPSVDPDGFLANMETYAGLGVGVVSVSPGLDADPVEWIEKVTASVVPRLSDL